MPRWLNIPNLFTLLRLALVPFVIQCILSGRHFAALALFAAAAATDLLDGAAARHFASSTQAGAYLDPIADKCLLSGVFLALAAASILPWWFVAIIFGRDLYILLAVAAIMLLTPVRRFPPSTWGKLSTFVQIVTAVAWMARDVLPYPVLDLFSSAMLWPCVGFTIWSGLHYTWRGIQVARAH
jgi:cardiolipin synthase (CMP-forming)